MSDRRFWKAPKLWPGGTCFIIGGGPSLRGMDLSAGRAATFTIAVNQAFEIAPWAEILFFGDNRWFRWNKPLLEGWAGRIITASAAVFQDGRVLRMNKTYEPPISDEPNSVFGQDSGCMAINLAYLLGAKKIVLAGFDMDFAPDGASHFHDKHQSPSDRKNYIEKFAPQYPGLIEALKKRGVEVVRCTPSALDFIPEVKLEDAFP